MPSSWNGKSSTADLRHQLERMRSFTSSIRWARLFCSAGAISRGRSVFPVTESKDIGENGFDVLKNDVDLMPANVRTDSVLRGDLFIAFLALVLRMKLMWLMIDAGLHKRYSLRRIAYGDGEYQGNDLA